MKKSLLNFLIVICGIASSTAHAQHYTINKDVKRIVFLGNSITYMGQYVSYIDAYLTLKYPDKKYEIINVGLPSETVSGLTEPNHAGGAFPRPDLHERLNRVLDSLHPDLVFACYGMNDGIYLPFDEERFQLFKAGIIWMHDVVERSGSEIIHITPAIYDPREGLAYANVLDIYSDWLLSKRYTSDWKVIDIHWSMKKYLEDQRLKDSAFRYAEDGIHPAPIGHFVMAKSILKALGEGELTSDTSMVEALSFCSKADIVLQLIEAKQVILKDAWLTSIGHKRLWMETGLPVEKAQLKADSIQVQIEKIINP